MPMQQSHDDWEIVSRGSDAESTESWALPDVPASGVQAVLTPTTTSTSHPEARQEGSSPECTEGSECESEWTSPFGGLCCDDGDTSMASTAAEELFVEQKRQQALVALRQQQQRRQRQQQDLAAHGFGQLAVVGDVRDVPPPQKQLRVRGSKTFQQCPRGKSAKQTFRQLQHRSAFTNVRKC